MSDSLNAAEPGSQQDSAAAESPTELLTLPITLSLADWKAVMPALDRHVYHLGLETLSAGGETRAEDLAKISALRRLLAKIALQYSRSGRVV